MIDIDVRSQRYQKCKCHWKQTAHQHCPLTSLQKYCCHDHSHKEKSTDLHQIPEYTGNAFIVCQKAPVKGWTHNTSRHKDLRLQFRKKHCQSGTDHIIQLTVRKHCQSGKDQKSADQRSSVPEGS